MAASRQRPPRITAWYQRLINPQRWEAPDRNFAGHRDILTRNLARYHFIGSYLRGTVLEVGCGRGYGLEVIQPWVAELVGVDISYAFLREAAQRFPLAQASGEALPFADRQFDSLVAFDVLEHIPDEMAFLDSLVRVARNGAFCAISTPNRLVASGNAVKPLDPYHVREYTAGEFEILLRRHFSSVILYGQHDQVTRAASSNRLIDRIPIRWKYLFPTAIQGRLSVALRQPLKLSDCRFEADNLETAHTFVALCQI